MIYTSVDGAGRSALNAAPAPQTLMHVECKGACTVGTVCVL